MSGFSLFFFFQAEDGIRDGTVTGIQTCALPIWRTAQSADVQRALATCPELPSPHVRTFGVPRTNGAAGKKTVRSAYRETVDSPRVRTIRTRFQRMRPRSLLLLVPRKISDAGEAPATYSPKLTSTSL